MINKEQGPKKYREQALKPKHDKIKIENFNLKNDFTDQNNLLSDIDNLLARNGLLNDNFSPDNKIKTDICDDDLLKSDFFKSDFPYSMNEMMFKTEVVKKVNVDLKTLTQKMRENGKTDQKYVCPIEGCGYKSVTI